MAGYWLLKTEPSTYSFAQLRKQRKTNWNDVRNFQARNFLKEIAPGDLALIYHSGDDKAVVGVAKVARAAYPDVDPETPGEWVQVDVAFERELARPVALKELKQDAALTNLLLIKQSRLSVMPVKKAEFDRILKLAEKE